MYLRTHPPRYKLPKQLNENELNGILTIFDST